MISIRASSLSDLFDCPARWEARNVKGLIMPSSPEAILGKAIHVGTAIYDEAQLSGLPVTADEAAGAVVDTIRRPEEDVDWEDQSKNTAEKIGIALHHLYCREVAPRQEYIAVEVYCERLDIPELGISLTGTADRVRRSGGLLGIADIKTGKAVVSADGTVSTQEHAAQIAVYELLASQALGEVVTDPAQIIGLQVAQTAKGRRIGVGTIEGGRDLLLGTDDEPGILEHAAIILKTGTFYGNPRSQICGKKYCPVYDVCKWRK